MIICPVVQKRKLGVIHGLPSSILLQIIYPSLAKYPT
jgi:hypothetical protein